MASNDNPVFSGDGRNVTNIDDIQTALERGDLTPAEAIREIEARMAKMEASVGAMIRAAGSGGPLESTIRGVVSRLTEAPPNLHQFAIFQAAALEASTNPENQAAGPLVVTVVAEALMVLMQCMVSVGVLVGTVLPACATSDQCRRGFYCHVGGRFRCNYCGTAGVPLPPQYDDAGNRIGKLDPRLNLTGLPAACADPSSTYPIQYPSSSFAGLPSAVASWCQTCVHPTDYTIDQMTPQKLLNDNVGMMGLFDWATLFFASCVVAFAVVGELKDIELVKIAIKLAGKKLNPYIRFFFMLLGGMRRWLFLPALVMTTPVIVVIQGGDALSICLNTVAILFMVEIDNVAYSIGLSERIRSNFEQHGRIKLEDADAVALVKSKATHVSLIVISVLVAVRAAKTSYSNDLPLSVALIVSPVLAFWLAGVIDSVEPGVGASEMCKRVAIVSLSWVAGVMGIGFFVANAEGGE